MTHPDVVIQWEAVAYAFRALLIGCSILFGTFGYRLFRLGVYDKQGELKASYHGMSLTFRQFGPGLGFALFAVAFAVVAMARGVSVQSPPADIGPTPGHTSVVTPAATGSFVSGLSQDSAICFWPSYPSEQCVWSRAEYEGQKQPFRLPRLPFRVGPWPGGSAQSVGATTWETLFHRVTVPS